jgi:hypothetical protein
VGEMASEVREGLDNLARAICCLAVERHASNPGQHRELAAVMWIDCVSDFREVKVTQESRNWLAQLLKIDPKTMPKGPIASDNTAFTVNSTPPTLTKGTQGSTGVSTQDLKDAGRSSIMVTASVASTATSETLISVNKSAGLAATGAASSNSITTGKRFRIQGIYASARNTTGTTAGVATIRLRAAVGGSTTASSPLQITTAVALPAAATSVNFPGHQHSRWIRDRRQRSDEHLGPDHHTSAVGDGFGCSHLRHHAHRLRILMLLLFAESFRVDGLRELDARLRRFSKRSPFPSWKRYK